MEVMEVCVRQISMKLYEIQFQYNLLELGHGVDIMITLLVEFHTN
jgi:hypothetical protein